MFIVLLDGQAVINEYIWDVQPMRLHAMAGAQGDSIEIKDLAIVHTTLLDSADARAGACGSL